MKVALENAQLRTRRDVDQSLAVFHVAPLDGPLPDFEPGQFTNLGLTLARPPAEAALCKRAFSIASSPREREHLEFYVRRVENGLLTPALFELRPGERLWLDARVHGRFTLEEAPPRSRILMVATGTGLAPFVSMLRTYTGRERWRRCVVLESARTARELGYRAELERIEHGNPTVAYHPTLTREPAESDWRGLRGRVQDWLRPAAFQVLCGEALAPEEWHVFLCGNPEMIAAVTELLALQGFRPHHRRAPGQIHSERYW